MQQTPIGWTDFSANVIKYRDPDGNVVHACVRASEGCRFCYAAALAGRWGRKGRDFTAENMKRLTPFFDEVEAKRVLTSKKITGKRVFVNDMTDWMGPWVSDEIIDSCMAVFALRPDVTFQTLTKHADRQRTQLTRLAKSIDPIEKAARALGYTLNFQGFSLLPWPIPNLHIGVSVEDQKNATKRIPHLNDTPAALRWISAEPLLGRINLLKLYANPRHAWSSSIAISSTLYGGGIRYRGIDWVVVGGESGAGHRAMDMVAFQRIVDQCKQNAVAVFVKQDSGARPGQQGRIPDALWLKEFPIAT